MKFFLKLAVTLLLLGVLSYFIWFRPSSSGDSREGESYQDRPVPVAVSEIRRGSIENRRVLSGTLEAHSEFRVAPKIAGQLTEIYADFSDSIERGQLLAELDGAEIQQQVLQAEANLAVAEANLVEAKSLWEISKREIDRFDRLRNQEFLSASDYENAEAQFLAREAQVKVAEAQLRRQQAVLESARIQQSYTEIKVDWPGAGDQRLVAERFHDVGDTVAANETIFRIVEIDPITAVIYITERDYVYIEPGQPATFETDAFKGEVFHGVVERVSPVFREATRQARVELAIQNPDHRLKPGMFVRVRLSLSRLDEATLVPEIAIARRQEQTGIFIADEAGETVSWNPVDVLILDEGTVAIEPEELTGRVITLGQHLLEDGSAISIADSILDSPAQP